MTRRFWTEAELSQLRLQYPHMPTSLVAKMLGCSVHRAYNKAFALGLKKTPAFLRGPLAGRIHGGYTPGARRNQFPKGHEPWNKGTNWKAGGRSVLTQFKKGSRPHTWRPVGSVRVDADGYRDLKVTDTGYPPRDWRACHVLLWEAANGPIPRGHAVRFKDGNKANITLDNLECISRADLMRRNTVHNYPQPIPQLVQLRGALQRQINRRGRA